jgi:glucokinase
MSGRWVLGVDIGGTNLVVGAVPFSGGTPVGVRSAPTPRDPDQAVSAVAGLAEAVIEEVLGETRDRGSLGGVGIGCPGPLDLDRGVVIATPNLGWRDYPIRGRISEALSLPASLDNDANCATYGEYWQGVGRGAKCLVGVTLGTGIGGGLILEGRVVRGVSSAAGEIGHTTIDFTGRRCACGNYGCLEAYASGPNIAARAREGLRAGYDSVLRSLVDDDLDRLTAATVYDALVQGDEYAQEVMNETAKILGAGIANVVNLLNPDRVVIVGGVTRAGEYLMAPLRSEVRRRAFEAAVSHCQILPGALPETAGVIGAAGIYIAEGPAQG